MNYTAVHNIVPYYTAVHNIVHYTCTAETLERLSFAATLSRVLPLISSTSNI